MGIPHHYAIDIPKRCYQLLNDYWGQIQDKPYEEFKGPLATTFLLAMAAQIITFPVERIAKKGKPAKLEHILTEKEVDAIDQELRHTALREAAFFQANTWRYQFVPLDRDITITELPEDVLHGFADPATQAAAAEIRTWYWIRTLRNAMSHSTVAYLDAGGTQTVNSAVTHILFISEDEPSRTTGHHLFLISREDFRRFLDRWMAWLAA